MVGKYKVSLPFENFIWLAVVQGHKFDNMRDGMCACWGLGSRGYQVSSPFENLLLYSRYWYIWHNPVNISQGNSLFVTNRLGLIVPLFLIV